MSLRSLKTTFTVSFLLSPLFVFHLRSESSFTRQDTRGCSVPRALLGPQTTNSIADIFVDNVHIELSLWDTAGQEEFDRLRSLSYDNTDVVVLCFSVDSKDSLENVESKWVGEIQENCPGVKLVLVALKCDLRENTDEEEEGGASAAAADGAQREKKPMIEYNQGLDVARRIKAMRYLECSAMRNRGVNEAFTEAARVALSVKPSGEQESKCVVM
ncbi:rho3 protein [Ustulina deusta]|nr:rho3 protein [Ustulina deusta]